MASSGIDGDPHNRPPVVIEHRTLFPTPNHEEEEYKRVGLSTSTIALIALLAAGVAGGGAWFLQQSTVQSLQAQIDTLRTDGSAEQVKDLETERDALQVEVAALQDQIDDISRDFDIIKELEAEVTEVNNQINAAIQDRRSAGAFVPRRLTELPEAPPDVLSRLSTARAELRDHVSTLETQLREITRIPNPPRPPCPSGNPENCDG